MESNPAKDLVFEISVDPHKGNYVATAQAFGIVATGDSLQELRINALDAVDKHFEETVPQPGSIRFLYPADGLLAE